MSNSGAHRSFLHSIFGYGKVADMMLWKNRTESAAMMGGFSAIWLLFVVLDYHFLTLLSYLLIFLMLLLFSWNKLALFTQWSPPNAHDFEISRSTLTHFFDTFNRLLYNFFEISSGRDFKLFAMVMGGLWLLSVIGELTNSLNLIYIVFVSLQVVPVVYEKYEEELKQVGCQLKSVMDGFFHTLHSNFFSKIPRRHRDQSKQT